MLDHNAIASLLPHSGSMVLLDSVESWTNVAIVCVTGSHRAAGNPLRQNSRLSSLCGVEYGVQAMAVHGALISGGNCRPGLLAALRNVRCHVAQLDEIGGDLTVRAKLLIGERGRFIYTFSIQTADATLLVGEAAVVLR